MFRHSITTTAISFTLATLLSQMFVTPPVNEVLPSFRCVVQKADAAHFRVNCNTRNPIPECQDSNSKSCQTLTMDLVTNHPSFRNWRLRAGPNENVEPFEAPLEKGQILKATWDEATGQLLPIASCTVRVHLRLRQRALQRPGELIPNALRTEPDDCQPWWEWKDK